MAKLASYNFNSCKTLSYEIMSGNDITSGYKMDKNTGGLHTVLPAKSNSGVMLSLQRNQGLVIYRSLVYKSYPQDSINTQVIVPFALAQVQCTS